MTNIVFVDGVRGMPKPYNRGEAGELRAGLIPQVLDIPVVNWQTVDTWISDIRADIFLVLMFPNAHHVCHRLKVQHPNSKVIAWIDPGADVFMHHYGTPHKAMITDLRWADAIGTWDEMLNHGQFFNQLTPAHVPVVYIPLPLLPGAEHHRGTEKQDMIMGVLHRQEPRNPYPTLAACAAIQRATGCKVILFDDHGKNAHARNWFIPDYHLITTFKGAYSAIPKCKFLLDLYTLRHYGRMATHAANLGTVSVTSPWCTDTGHIMLEPWSDKAAQCVIHEWHKDHAYWHERGYKILTARHDPIYIRRQITSILED